MGMKEVLQGQKRVVSSIQRSSDGLKNVMTSINSIGERIDRAWPSDAGEKYYVLHALCRVRDGVGAQTGKIMWFCTSAKKYINDMVSFEVYRGASFAVPVVKVAGNISAFKSVKSSVACDTDALRSLACEIENCSSNLRGRAYEIERNVRRLDTTLINKISSRKVVFGYSNQLYSLSDKLRQIANALVCIANNYENTEKKVNMLITALQVGEKSGKIDQIIEAVELQMSDLDAVYAAYGLLPETLKLALNEFIPGVKEVKDLYDLVDDFKKQKWADVGEDVYDMFYHVLSDTGEISWGAVEVFAVIESIKTSINYIDSIDECFDKSQDAIGNGDVLTYMHYVCACAVEVGKVTTDTLCKITDKVFKATPAGKFTKWVDAVCMDTLHTSPSKMLNDVGTTISHGVDGVLNLGGKVTQKADNVAKKYIGKGLKHIGNGIKAVFGM